MRALLIAIWMIVSVSAFSQSELMAKPKPVFHSINQLGMLEGEGGTAFQIQTINGLKYRKFFAGVGVGLDYYKIRSIPVFLDLRHLLLKEDRAPFVYIDAGWNFPWYKPGEDLTAWGWEVSTGSGLFYEGGFGYRFPFKTTALLISAGYSYKAYTYTEKYTWTCIGCPGEYRYHYSHRLRRASIKLGFSF